MSYIYNCTCLFLLTTAVVFIDGSAAIATYAISMKYARGLMWLNLVLFMLSVLTGSNVIYSHIVLVLPHWYALLLYCRWVMKWSGMIFIKLTGVKPQHKTLYNPKDAMCKNKAKQLGMSSANERRCIVTSCFVGWAHNPNDLRSIFQWVHASYECIEPEGWHTRYTVPCGNCLSALLNMLNITGFKVFSFKAMTPQKVSNKSRMQALNRHRQ